MKEQYENISLISLEKPKDIVELDPAQIEMRVIDWHTASKIIKENHYSHVAPMSQINLGFYIAHKLSTVIMYSGGANYMAAKGVVEDGQQKDMLELVRLFSFDWAPKNIESYCIGQSFKWLKENSKKKWLISYADLNEGHVGTIYQATNWLYTGLGAKGKQLWLLDGEPIHTRTTWEHTGTADIDKITQMYADMGKKFEVKQDLLPKARYIYFLCNKREKKKLIEKLRVPIFNRYPKSYEEALVMEREQKDR